jgi:hypothetical protein
VGLTWGTRKSELCFWFEKNCRRNLREKKNEMMNENEIMNEAEMRKLVECPKQQYWSKYLKRGRGNDVVTDMVRDLGLVFDQIGVEMSKMMW